MEKVEGHVIRIFHREGYAFIRGADGFSRFAHCKNFLTEFELVPEGARVRYKPLDTAPQRRGDGTIKNDGKRAVEVELW